MIAPLRRRHLYIWLILGPLLLTGVNAAWLMAPEFPTENYNERNIHFPELIRSVVSDNYVFNLQRNYGGESQLEILQISDINPVSELVRIQYFKARSKKMVNEELGMMAGEKSYFYSLGNIIPPFAITITDTIKRKTLAKIEF